MQAASEQTDIDIKTLNAELLARYKRSPSVRLRNHIVQLNHDLARFVASRESFRRQVEPEDLEQLAVMGLIKAVERYDPQKCSSFSSFAVPYIVGEIKHFCRDKETTIKVPRRWREQADSVRKAQLDLLAQGRDVSLEAIALSMGLAPNEWQEIQSATTTHKLVSIDEDDTLELAAIEPGEDFRTDISNGLALLPEPHRNCLIEKFFADLPETIIAVRHDLPVERVNTLIAEGLKQLRAA